MITVTEAAIAELKRIIVEENKPSAVRIAMQGGGCSGFTVDMHFTKWPADEKHDHTISIDDIKFFIDDKSALFVRGATLDYGGGLLDKGFKWNFPSATGGCGCGTSFSF